MFETPCKHVITHVKKVYMGDDANPHVNTHVNGFIDFYMVDVVTPHVNSIYMVINIERFLDQF